MGLHHNKILDKCNSSNCVQTTGPSTFMYVFTFCALIWIVRLELLVETDSNAFSVRLSQKGYRVSGLEECSECDGYLSQCLTQRSDGWSREMSRHAAALNCCKTIVCIKLLNFVIYVTIHNI